jgi:hypothetical protein
MDVAVERPPPVKEEKKPETMEVRRVPSVLVLPRLASSCS